MNTTQIAATMPRLTPPIGSHSKRIPILVGLYLLAFLLRLVAALVFTMNHPLSSDEPEYYYPAVCLTEGLGYAKIPQQAQDQTSRPTAYRVPGPSLVLASVFAVFGASVELARWMSVVVASLSAPFMYLFASKFTRSGVALLSAVACAFYPTHVFYSLDVSSEAYFIPALLLSLTLALVVVESRGLWIALIVGAAWGITTLIRPHGLPMFGLVTLYVLCQGEWRKAAVMVLGLACLLGPWVVRNRVVLGRTVLLATEGGETLLGANNPYVMDDPKLHGMWVSPMALSEYREHLAPIQDEIDRDNEQKAMAMTYLSQNVDKIPALALNKVWRWLTPLTVTGGMIRVAVLCSYGILLALLFAGLFLNVYRSTTAFHMVLMWTAVLVGLTCVYWGGLTRGRLPLEIIWLPWGASAAWNLFRLLFGKPMPAVVVAGCDTTTPNAEGV